MVRNLRFSLVFLTLFNGFAMGEWNILNQNGKNKFGISLKNYCESWRMNVELHNIKNFKVTPQECIEYIGKYMTSTQYKVDIGVALDQVTLYLSSNILLKGDGKDAWVFDIDDTLLSIVPYFKNHNNGGEKINKSCLEAWMKTSKAPTVEHSLNLYNDIKGRGIKIFLISSRAELLREATIDNLVHVGYYGWTGLILRGLKDDSISIQSFKADQRKKLKDAGYRLLGIVGDHWSSFDGYPAANGSIFWVTEKAKWSSNVSAYNNFAAVYRQP